MALETLNNRYGIRHFDEGGSTDAPTGTVTVTGAPNDAFNFASPNFDANAYMMAAATSTAPTAQANTQQAAPSGALDFGSADFNPQAYAQQAGATYTAPTTPGQVDIAGLYTNILGRPLDQAGFDYWTGQANKGASLDAITQSFKDSAEYKALPQNTTAATQGGLTTLGSTQAISDWYQNTLGRPADESGLASWSKAFGNTLDPTELALLNQTPEAQNRNAIINAYKTDVGRVGTPEEYNTWMQAIAGGSTIDQVKANIAAAPEAQLYSAYMAETGRAPDADGYKYFSDRLAQGATIEQIRQEMSGSDEGQKYDVNNLYKEALFRDAKPEELTEITGLLKQGYTLDLLRQKAYERPEVIVTQDYMKYLGRTPDETGLKNWTDQLATGKTKEQIAHDIALSDESIRANSASVKANLEAVLGKNVVAGLTPEQITEYTRTILDPTRAAKVAPVSQDQFDTKYYLNKYADVAAAGVDPYQHYLTHGIAEGRSGNATATPTYATQAQNLLEVYKNIALDPVLGPKLKAENPELWEQVTPLAYRPEDLERTERTTYGQYGTVKMDGIEVPILNGQWADKMFGGEESGTISDFSHSRGRLTSELGWSSNSFSGKMSKGADALGVTKTVDSDYGNTSYSGLNEAADLLKIDKSQFKDTQVQDVTKPQYDETGNVIDPGGKPAFTTDDYGNQTPVMKTITAEDQLYKAVSAAAKDIYSYTGDALTPGQGGEGGAKSFDTVLYKRTGDELIPITKPVSHGGMQNADIYFKQDNGLSTALTLVVAVAAMAVAPQLSAYLVTSMGVGTATAAVMTGVIVGAGVGAANATISGKSIGDASLKGGAIGGVTAGVTAGLAEGLSSAFPPSVAADGTKVANSVFTGASEMMNGAISPEGVQSVVTQTLARTLTTGITPGANGDKILNAFGTALVSSGLSVAASEQIVSQMTAAGFDKDNVAKLARTVQLAVNTGSTAALSGKSNEQILQSIITGVVSGAPSIAKASSPPVIEPTNPFGTENVGHTSGSVDKVLQSQIMDGIANNTDDPIAFMNAAKNWTGDGSKNVQFVTTEMVRQGIPADQISADLQELYRISANKADEYANYMVTKAGITVKPTTTATTTTTQQPTTTVANQTSAPVTAPAPDNYSNQLFGSMVDAFSNPSVAGPAYATLAQALPVSRYDVGSSSPLVTSGATQSNLGGTSPANDPTSYRTYSPRPGADEYSNVYPSLTGRAAQDPNYIRELVEAYKADPSYAPYREELQRLDPKNPVLANNEVRRVESPEQTPQTPQIQSRVPSYKPELSALPKPVEPPMPEPRPEPAPMPATPSPNEPANDPFILPEPNVPGRKITPIVPVSPPGALPSLPPNSVPLQDPNKNPIPDIKPLAPPSDQPVTPSTPATPTAPVQEPTGEPEKENQPTPEQQQIIQKVAKTPEEGKRLEIAVPKVTKLITQGVPRTVAIPTVAREVGVPVEDLTTVIDVTVPEVTPPTVTPPTVTPPKVTAPKVSAPTTTAGKTGVISPFLLQQYGGIQDLSPGLTEGGKYSLSGIPSTNLNMNPTTPNSPLQQFASTSPPSPLELGAQQQPDEPIQMAAGGSTTQQAYNPYDVSSGISGSLTPGLTKARLDYLLTGLPQSHAEGGIIEGHNPQFFSEGGLGSMNNTFVKGEGDGTSDQVPAMLANGEFVIPADIVSGLGNGSNDAGAQVLQEFLKVIREHKHSAKANKLPPKSKGPLAYLTNAKRKVKVA